MKYSVTKRFTFEAAHHLPYHEGVCKSPHGHSYKLEVTVSSPTLRDDGPQKGMVVDFGELSDVVKGNILKRLDHSDLNGIFPNPTAENVAKWIFDELYWCSGTLEKVKLWETEDNSVEVTG